MSKKVVRMDLKNTKHKFLMNISNPISAILECMEIVSTSQKLLSFEATAKERRVSQATTRLLSCLIAEFELSLRSLYSCRTIIKVFFLLQMNHLCNAIFQFHTGLTSNCFANLLRRNVFPSQPFIYRIFAECWW